MKLGKAPFSDKNVLVVGGAGFIGSHLAATLSLNNRVTVFDNLSSGKVQNLEKFRNKITFIEGDVCKYTTLKEIVAGADYVFHLAANVAVMKSIEAPVTDMRINIEGTLNLLEACIGSKIKRFVYSGSAAIFGQAKYLPVDEEHPVSPESPYAVSKLAAEKYCFAFHKIHGLPISVVRYFNAYGPRQSSSGYANVIQSFFNKVKEDKPLTIYGDGKQSRDFVFVGDIVQANILAASQPAAVGEAFNIGTGIETSLNDLVHVINKVTGRENRVEYGAHRAGEVRNSLANIDKARHVLGYVPQTDIIEGIRLTWQAEQAVAEV
jgi:UDP-glucose 4-epimerase